MDKITYNQEQQLLQKDLENLLWQVFWSYEVELGLTTSEERKTQMVQRAVEIIPEFAESAMELTLTFSFQLITIFLSSLQQYENLLAHPDLQAFMKIEGPDNDAKLAYLTRNCDNGETLCRQ